MSDNEITSARLSTGNEYVSIPDIFTSGAGIRDIGFVHHGFRGCIEMHGSAETPLLAPVVEVGGEDVFAANVAHDCESFWIPRFSVDRAELGVTYRVFAPIERRGFVCVLEIENRSGASVRLTAGWRGSWAACYYVAGVARLMTGAKHAGVSPLHAGVPVLEFRGHAPMFALSLLAGDRLQTRISGAGRELSEWTGQHILDDSNGPVNYELLQEIELSSGGRVAMPLYVGLGLEEVSAVASAKELALQGWERAHSHLRGWLDARTTDSPDPAVKRLINVNGFYNYFYSQAIALDSEELILTSARSSLNNCCGSYSDRDAMRWSLPSVLRVNSAQARKMLICAFTTQLKNIGVCSRFIDGTVLEPGLSLDQLCAPLRALSIYVESTNDMSILFDRRVQAGVNAVQQVLAVQRHPEIALFESLLLPGGEYSRHPYICYSNVLVWRILRDVGLLYDRIRDIDRADEATKLAEKVRSAILRHFVVRGPLGEMFALSTDLEGNHQIGDDPFGSLQLLSYLEFCLPDDPVFTNTVDWIHSEHNPMARCGKPFAAASAHPDAASILSVVNDLLGGRVADGVEFLSRTPLDDGIACESVDCGTGRAIRGRAFASCAGFLSYALSLALNAPIPEAAMIALRLRPSEVLYQPPPETREDTRKARL